MSRYNVHELLWERESQRYIIHSAGKPLIPAVIPESPAWYAWLGSTPSLAFTAQSGTSFTLRQERVQRGGTYWYAYRRIASRPVKRYLGRSADLTLERLEATAATFSSLASADVPQQRSPRYGTKKAHQPKTSDGRPSLPLLATKFQVPRAPAQVLERFHLHQQLQRGLTMPW